MNPLYAFDNYFENTDRPYALAEVWDHLKSLGFDLAYFSINRSKPESWNKLIEASQHRRRTGLGLAAVYTVVEFPEIHTTSNPRVSEMIDLLEKGDTLELAISFGWEKDLSDPRHDEEVIDWLKPLLAQAKNRQVTISLYHHFNFWMERIEDTIRLAQTINDPSLGVTFCGYHWYTIDRKDLRHKLQLAAPWMKLANLCGARPLPPGASPLPVSIEPVGAGEFPLAEFLQGLKNIQYAGPIGFQGYLIGGNPDEKLALSISNYRQALQSLP